ncbi:serine hydrolase [Vibrio sinaloensis]|uniref:serine hydrolase n=1 Tax=Photobacterium sp. (strain ATCC 43367) TaxID=379097 RepID=UPI0020543F3F|nr:serine hydrolase [Vibrio sinaloensis]UPQ89423.1 serine hydrolase [Vibrio sinaloensis]
MKTQTSNHTQNEIDLSRRNFMSKGAAVGATAGLVGMGLASATNAIAAPTKAPAISDISTAISPLEVESNMARWKLPQSIDFVNGATERFGFRNWQSGNDDSVYYNLNIPSFFKSSVVAPPFAPSTLERQIDERIKHVSFTAHDGSKTPTLERYLTGPKQVQAMMMAHKGKVVFETYPGMNPTDFHVWMSASKTTAGLLVSMLAQDGKIDLSKPVSHYVTELKGSAWDKVSVKDTMNMAPALDNEETFESLSNPKSWMSTFFTAIFESPAGSHKWRELLKEVQPLPNEKPGERFRYSTANTQVLVLVVESVTNMSWQHYWNQRVWSKIGAKNSFIVGLTPDGTPIGGGLNFTTAEDMLRYAMIYTPSYQAVSNEQIVDNELLRLIQNMGSPEAYKISTELEYGKRWFGETPKLNTAQWDHAFADGAMFKHGNMGQGIYVDPKRDFCAIYFGLASNDESVTGIDHSPGYLRNAAKLMAGF